MTWTSKHETALEQLNLLIKQGKSREEGGRTLAVLGLDGDFIEQVVERHVAIAADVFRLKTSPTVDASDAEPWYAGVQPGDIFWPKLRDHLMQDANWAPAVTSLDSTSRDVVARLGDPSLTHFAKRGLVVGYVQSGKTANFTATIAKAADTGYRLFVVLSGVHNSLRRQTQLRLEKQIVDLNPINWITLTSETADFGNPVQALPLLAGSPLRLLAVVKKNVSRLSNLVEWLSTAQKHGALDDCPVLIIDDEADQASVNTAKDAELDQTAIHAKIKELLSLPKVSYLGYTATPFANVLCNPKDALGIYPRDFIYSLPKPEGYFGAEELFGAAVLEDEESRVMPGHDMIRFVPAQEALGYAVKNKQAYSPLISPSLGDAIRWFVMATAARRARSGEVSHSSMLVHTTMRVAPQMQFVPVVRKFLKALAAEWASGHVDSWRSQWDFETIAEPAERHGLTPISFSEMSVSVNDVLSKVHVVADNSSSDDRLIYSDDPATVIAIGGNTLSRGLTLEGLVSSFFLRSSGMYDSALQMGRWFGYRPGYADLPRVWTTAALASNFEFLSRVEASIREDINRYAEKGITPSKLAVRLLLHPKMQATAKLKMQYAVPVTSSFSESRPQTIHFEHKNYEIVNRNLDVARALLENVGLTAEFSGQLHSGTKVLRGVDAKEVIRFLDRYSFHADSEMAGGYVAEYVKRQVDFGGLRKWNIAIVGNKNASNNSVKPVEIGGGLWFHPVNRSQIQGYQSDVPNTAYLKAITSTADFSADIAEEYSISNTQDAIAARNDSGVPLLVLYPIEANSVPGPQANRQPNGVVRVPLEAVNTLVGVALSLPQAVDGSEPEDMIQVDLRSLSSTDVSDSYDADDAEYEDSESSLNQVSFDGH
ncbi:Z1 domain-containing protein [Arthrobacter sp. D3-18]